VNNEIRNKALVIFAQGEKELQNAHKHLGKSIDGKVRAIVRRAAGFYIDGLLTLSPRDNYGSSFINHLKALQFDSTVPEDIRNSAEVLTLKVGDEDLSGIDAIRHGESIIDYCKISLHQIKSEFF